MSDSYQPIYDAVRSRISGCNVGQAVEQVLINIPGDIARYAQNCFSEIACSMASPSVVYKPEIYQDGDHWCCLYGKDIQSGVVGFGKSPAEACAAFDRAWHTPLALRAEGQGEK
jgi:hypothetical protein